MDESTNDGEPVPVETRTRVPREPDGTEPKRDDTEPIATTTRAP
jgi:hypothetical protein